MSTRGTKTPPLGHDEPWKELSMHLFAEVQLLEREVAALEDGLNDFVRSIDTERILDDAPLPRWSDPVASASSPSLSPSQRFRISIEKLPGMRSRLAGTVNGLREVARCLHDTRPPAKQKIANEFHPSIPQFTPPPTRAPDRDTFVPQAWPATAPSAPAPVSQSQWPTALTGVAKLIDLYNRALEDRSASDEFRDTFEPTRIGTANAVERRHNAQLAAQFTRANDGDFFAVPCPSSTQYWVVPRFGLTIDGINYGAGAIGVAFSRTPGHNPQLNYSRYRLETPAVFAQERGQWVLVEPGKLNLGMGV